MIEFEFIHKHRDFIRSRDTRSPDGVPDSKVSKQTKHIAEHLNRPDLDKLVDLLSNDSFLELCDLLRIDNAVSRKEKTYDNFPLDLLELIAILRITLKKGK